mmetsp:Transcript_7747/g.17009  ORF Transcript_7747/g.17009 Transcript_7747/m.17009 type:complete len:252 (+) Transcript_7747:145-900(+)
MACPADPQQLKSIGLFIGSLARELESMKENGPLQLLNPLMSELRADGLRRALEMCDGMDRRSFLEALTGNIHKFPMKEQHELARVLPVQVSAEYRNLPFALEDAPAPVVMRSPQEDHQSLGFPSPSAPTPPPSLGLGLSTPQMDAAGIIPTPPLGLQPVLSAPATASFAHSGFQQGGLTIPTPPLTTTGWSGSGSFPAHAASLGAAHQHYMGAANLAAGGLSALPCQRYEPYGLPQNPPRPVRYGLDDDEL